MTSSGHPDNPQCVERYVWHVTYVDGTTLCEYPVPTLHRSFTEVDAANVVRLTMMPNPWLDVTGPEYVVVCDPERGLEPVMVRKNAVNTENGASARWHVFGTRQDGREQLLYLPDGPEPYVVVTDQHIEIGA
jgi:hypothetical protein